MGLVPGARIPKEEVHYRQHEKCLSCVHFFAPNSCEVVAGNISPEAVCSRWEVREPDHGKDGEYYKQQYEKKAYIKNPGYESWAKFYMDMHGDGK